MKVPAWAAILLAVFVVLFMVVATGALWFVSYVVVGEDASSSFVNTFFIQCFVFAAIIGGTLLVGRLFGRPVQVRAFGLGPARWSVVALSAVAGLALTFPLGELDNWWQHVLPASDEEVAMMIAIHDPASALERVFIVLALVGAAAAGEEIVFRGIIWGWIREASGPRTALVVTSVLFGCAHVFLWRTIPLIIPVGFLFGWIVLRCGSVGASMAAHAAFNGVPILASWSGLVITGWNDLTAEDPHLGPVLLAAGSAVLLASLAGIHVLTRGRTTGIDGPSGLN